MVRHSLTLEQFIDEWYITEGDLLYGRVIDMDRDNYYVKWEDEEVKVPIHGYDNVMRYVQQYYKDHKPV